MTNLFQEILANIKSENTEASEFVNTSAATTEKITAVINERNSRFAACGELILVATDENWGIVKLTAPTGEFLHAFMLEKPSGKNDDDDPSEFSGWQFLVAAPTLAQFMDDPRVIEGWCVEQRSMLNLFAVQNHKIQLEPRDLLPAVNHLEHVLDQNRPTSMQDMRIACMTAYFRENFKTGTHLDITGDWNMYDFDRVVVPGVYRNHPDSEALMAIHEWTSADLSLTMKEADAHMTEFVAECLNLPEFPSASTFKETVRTQLDALVDEGISLRKDAASIHRTDYRDGVFCMINGMLAHAVRFSPAYGTAFPEYRTLLTTLETASRNTTGLYMFRTDCFATQLADTPEFQQLWREILWIARVTIRLKELDPMILAYCGHPALRKDFMSVFTTFYTAEVSNLIMSNMVQDRDGLETWANAGKNGWCNSLVEEICQYDPELGSVVSELDRSEKGLRFGVAMQKCAGDYTPERFIAELKSLML